MDFDHDSEFVPVSPSQLPSTPWHTRDADTDLVKWQGSQTSSVALNALMKEAAKPTRRSPRNRHVRQLLTEPLPGPSFSGSSGSSSTSTSGSNPAFPSKSRPIRPRTRHLSAQIASTSFLTATPASSISTDPTHFLQTLKDVSEKVKVDESARAKKRSFTGEVKGMGSVPTGMRSGKEKENLRRSTTGVRESEKAQSPTIGSRGLPIIGGGGDERGDEDMVIDGSTTFQMDGDVEMNAGPSERRLGSPYDEPAILSTSTSDRHTRGKPLNSRSHMPPPPVPVPKAHPPRPPHDRLAASRSTSNPVPITLGPKPKPKSTSPQPAPPAPTLQPQPSQPPLLSQQLPRLPNSQLSSRPPALGMRRSLSTYSALAPSQSLPEKRKGFRVPLAKPAPTPTPAPSYRHADSKLTQVLPTPEPSPPIAITKVAGNGYGGSTGTQHRSSSPMPDADSSYGDISFDMDALEETMKKYD